MAYTDQSLLPRVVVSGIRARQIVNAAATEYVTAIIVGDSRATVGGQGTAYCEMLNYLATQHFGIPQWSEMMPVGSNPPGTFGEDRDGSLRLWSITSIVGTSQGSTATGYDKAVSKANSLPNFPNQAFSQSATSTFALGPEGILTQPLLNAGNAKVMNRSTSTTIELWSNGVSYPYNDGTTNWTGQRTPNINLGYTVMARRTSILPGYINNDAANLVTVGGFASGGTVTVPNPAVGAVDKVQVAVPYKQSDSSGYPSFGFFSLGAGATLYNLWGHRWKDPISTNGLSFTSTSAGGYLFTSIPSLHNTSQAQVQAVCEKSTKAIIWFRFGLNDAIGSGLSAATIEANCLALIQWYQAALSSKDLLFVWDGYTTELDDGLANWAARLAIYKQVMSCFMNAASAAGANYIAVNGGRMQEEAGLNETNESVAVTPDAWNVGTAYVAGNRVYKLEGSNITPGGRYWTYECIVPHTGKDPEDQGNRGCWTQVRMLLGGQSLTEKIHQDTNGQLVCARNAWLAMTAMPMYTASGALLTGNGGRKSIVPLQC